jgi:hypothetical protein
MGWGQVALPHTDTILLGRFLGDTCQLNRHFRQRLGGRTIGQRLLFVFDPDLHPINQDVEIGYCFIVRHALDSIFA